MKIHGTTNFGTELNVTLKAPPNQPSLHIQLHVDLFCAENSTNATSVQLSSAYFVFDFDFYILLCPKHHLNGRNGCLSLM